jgi:hypothetical protein
VPTVATAARGSRLGLRDLGDLSPPTIEEVGGATVDGGAAGQKQRKEKGADSARKTAVGGGRAFALSQDRVTP